MRVREQQQQQTISGKFVFNAIHTKFYANFHIYIFIFLNYNLSFRFSVFHVTAATGNLVVGRYYFVAEMCTITKTICIYTQ